MKRPGLFPHGVAYDHYAAGGRIAQRTSLIKQKAVAVAAAAPHHLVDTGERGTGASNGVAVKVKNEVTNAAPRLHDPRQALGKQKAGGQAEGEAGQAASPGAHARVLKAPYPCAGPTASGGEGCDRVGSTHGDGG